MWVEIKKEVFESEENNFYLRKLIQDLCYKHKYDVYIDIPNVIELPTFISIYDDIKDIIIEYFDKFITQSPSVNYSISNDGLGEKKFTLEEAITFFNKSFIIILENSDNDSFFLDTLINVFKKSSRKIRRFKDENWLEYGNSGGSGNIIHFIERIKRDFDGDIRFLKCFVLLDSDLEYPQIPNPKRLAIEEYLSANDVPYHILEKREIENYLPEKHLINTVPNPNVFIQTIINKLTPIQKDYIDIENGFGMDSKALENNKPIVYDFFLNERENGKQNEEKLNNLRIGIKGHFNNFKNEFPKFFEHSTQEELLERTKDQKNHNELKEILEKISKLL